MDLVSAVRQEFSAPIWENPTTSFFPPEVEPPPGPRAHT
jgi:hypothetical protein